MYPDLVIRQIRQYYEGEFAGYLESFIRYGVPAESWENIEVCRAWFETTKTWHDRFPKANKSNPEFALLVAEHAFDAFMEISPQLRNDAEFVIRAIHVNPCTYLKLSETLIRDWKIDLATFSTN